MNNTNAHKPGYKLTPLGWIPDDWEIRLLPEVSSFQEGPGLRNWQFTKSGMKVINVTNLEDGYINLSKTDRHISIDEFHSKYSHFSIDIGDIVMASSGATYCKIAVVRKDDLPLLMNTSVIRFKANKNISYQFLLSFLSSSLFKKQIDFMITGGAQPNFGPVHLKETYIPLPPLLEQNFIAPILNTWNEAIQKTQYLIEHQKQRNKGLSQQLLSGKKRLKGFSGQWVKKGADEIFKSHSQKKNGNEQLLSVTQDKGAIPRDMLEGRVTMPDSGTDGYKLVEPGNFIISLRSFQGGLEYSEYRGLVSPAYTVLKPVVPINDQFYRCYFKSYDFIGHLAVAVIGIRDGKQISFDDFCVLRLPYPSLQEQKAIAEILNKADNELKLYEQQLANLQQQKKGLMQKLLSGEVRVKL
jgi:type I restriction enzyme S subunit